MDWGVRVSRRNLLAAAAFASALRRATAQQDPTFSADVKVVNVLVTVRDRKGQPVRGLTRDDFVIEESGRPQTIRYFSVESDLPLTLGLLVDTSGSQRSVLEDERGASFRFFEQVLREDRDKAFVIHFEAEVELLQDVTSSRARLEKALELLEVPDPQRRPQWGQRGQIPGGGRRGGRGGMGTSVYDAVLLASTDVMGKLSGRKAIVLLSDGGDNASRVTLEEAVEAAQRADALVYSILFEDPESFGIGTGPNGGRGGRGWDAPDGKDVLQKISRETGGRMFELGRKRTISQAYAAIEEDLRNQYSLGYSPERSEPGYHKIRVTTKPRGLNVQAREGYYT